MPEPIFYLSLLLYVQLLDRLIFVARIEQKSAHHKLQKWRFDNGSIEPKSGHQKSVEPSTL